MPDNCTTHEPMDSLIEPLMDFWAKSVEQNQEQSRVLLETMREGGDLRALRRRWLDSLGKSFDTYMRTPAFLEAMRASLEAATHCRAHAEDLAQEAARETGVPRMADISGLFERVRLGQEAILARLDAIERRLESSPRNEKKAKGHDSRDAGRS